MATNEKPARGPSAELGQAAERGEHWWPVALAIAAVVGLHVALAPRYRLHPSWLVVAIPVVLLVALIVGDPGRIDRQRLWLRIVTGIMIALITLANLYAAIRLVVDILTNNKVFANNPGGLLAVGGVVWATNVIAFALWYWDYVAAGWVPRFVDYLSLAFWTATAFSPTDISAVRPWAKLLMMLQAAASLSLATLVIARAINIL